MLPSGQISHATDGRIRARIPERKGDERFFARVREELKHEPGISRLQTNPVTGSVLVVHDLDHDRIAALVESHGLFHLERGPAGVAADDAPDLGALLGSLIRSRSSFRYEAFATALVGLAVYEALKGNITAPATTLLWYAFRLLQDSSVMKAPAPNSAAPQAVEDLVGANATEG